MMTPNTTLAINGEKLIKDLYLDNEYLQKH